MNLHTNSTSTNQTNATGLDERIDELGDLWAIMKDTQVAFLSFTICAALVGNVLVLSATYRDKRLHNANKLFVACLAASDLLVAMFSVTLRLDQYVREKKTLTILFCRFWIWVDIFSEAASITTIMVISIDRYYKVYSPFKYKANMTTHRARCIIGAIWVYSAILGGLGLLPYGKNRGVYVKKSTCMNENRTFYTLAAFLGFFLPVVILIIVCILIFRIVQNHNNRRLPARQDNDSATRIHQKPTRSKTRSLKTLSLIVVTFIICWGPFFILFLIHQYNPQILRSKGERYFLILNGICFGLLPYANSFLNPIIYGYFDETFKAAISEMLANAWCAKKRPFATTSTVIRQSTHL